MCRASAIAVQLACNGRTEVTSDQVLTHGGGELATNPQSSGSSRFGLRPGGIVNCSWAGSTRKSGGR